MTAPKFDTAMQDAIGNYWHDVADQIERLFALKTDDFSFAARQTAILIRENAHSIAYGFNMGTPADETAAYVYGFLHRRLLEID